MRPSRTALLALAVSLVAVPAASASTVRLEPGGGEEPSRLIYAAGAGETNVTSIAVDGSKATISDTGATIAVQQGCASVDAHHATCDLQSSTSQIDQAEVTLLDGSDSFTMSGARSIVDGGLGNDTLNGGEMSDLLNGGGGTDTLHGGAGFDSLSDGDTSAGANADVLDGGPDSDWVDYRDRTAALTVDLADPGTDGQAGEGDTLTSIENATGGSGNDTLSGTDGPNDMNGGDGNDTIDGRAGDDFLNGGNGDDVLIGGPGIDQLFDGAGNDVLQLDNPPGTRDRYLSCEGGNDLIVGPGVTPSIPITCERGDFGFGYVASLVPKKATKKIVKLSIPCPAAFRDAGGVCHGALVVEPKGAYAKSKKFRRKHRFARKEFSVTGAMHGVTAQLNAAGRKELAKKYFKLQFTVVLKETASGTTRRFAWTSFIVRAFLPH